LKSVSDFFERVARLCAEPFLRRQEVGGSLEQLRCLRIDAGWLRQCPGRQGERQRGESRCPNVPQLGFNVVPFSFPAGARPRRRKPLMSSFTAQ
jgi:hypothetical protein